MLKVERGATYGARLVTTEPIPSSTEIASFAGAERIARPSYLSIQIGPGTHVEDIGLCRYLNHSCQPTTIVDVARLRVVAARDIPAGEELSFFYPSTEWQMDRPFECLCGAPDCLGTISGAKDVPAEVLHRYFVNPHIWRMKENEREQL
jgi:hypothetical protein